MELASEKEMGLGFASNGTPMWLLLAEVAGGIAAPGSGENNGWSVRFGLCTDRRAGQSGPRLRDRRRLTTRRCRAQHRDQVCQAILAQQVAYHGGVIHGVAVLGVHFARVQSKKVELFDREDSGVKMVRTTCVGQDVRCNLCGILIAECGRYWEGGPQCGRGTVRLGVNVGKVAAADEPKDPWESVLWGQGAGCARGVARGSVRERKNKEKKKENSGVIGRERTKRKKRRRRKGRKRESRYGIVLL